MKKHLCIAAAACGLFSLASCSDDENVIVDQPIVAEGEQVISLDVQNTDVLSTKSRPLYSTENKGAEDVSHVILYVFKSENGGVYKYDKQFSITDWNTTSTDYIYGRKRAFSIPKDEKLELGAKYMIFAVGQNEQNAASQIPAPFKFGDSTSLLQQLIGGDASELAGGTEHTWPNATGAGEGILTTNAVSYEIDDASKNNKKVVSEIFSGVSTEIDLSKPIVTDTQPSSSLSATNEHKKTYHFHNQRTQSTRYLSLLLISSLVSRFLIKTYTDKNEKRH